MDYFELLIGLYIVGLILLISSIWEVDNDVENRRLRSRIRTK